MAAFLSAVLEDHSGVDPLWKVAVPPENPHCAHLALSGVSHIEFGEQAKPFPKHWGEPPNTQLKGHNGIMRALPGGYGKVRKVGDRLRKQAVDGSLRLRPSTSRAPFEEQTPMLLSPAHAVLLAPAETPQPTRPLFLSFLVF